MCEDVTVSSVMLQGRFTGAVSSQSVHLRKERTSRIDRALAFRKGEPIAKKRLTQEHHMNNIDQLLEKKERSLERLRAEIDALRLAKQLLTEEEEHGASDYRLASVAGANGSSRQFP